MGIFINGGDPLSQPLLSLQGVPWVWGLCIFEGVDEGFRTWGLQV